VLRYCNLLTIAKDIPLIELIHPVTIYNIYLPSFLLLPRLAIDLFIFYSKYYILVYKSCAYTVAPLHLTAHIANKYTNNIYRQDSLYRPIKIAKALATHLTKEYNLFNPSSILYLLPTNLLFPNLKLYCSY
jgi:hypothetical protein